MRGQRKIDVPRLCQSMSRSRLVLKYFRDERREAVRQFVGRHWSEEGTSEKVPVNLLSLYIRIISTKLVAHSPRVMLSTFDRSLRPTVSAMEDWANKEIERMQLVNTLHRVVVDALFSIGIMKVALADPGQAAAVAWQLGAGQPFCERVDLDDFVYDVHARSFDEVGYIGHRYRVPLDVVKESKVYGKKRKDLVASTDTLYNAEGDERISVLGRGVYSSDDFEDYIDLWEVYLPRHRVVLTLADDYLSGPSQDMEPLREQNWIGPATGPYHILSYGVVPGNAMPKAPVQDLIDLHLGVNQSYRKVQRTTDRIKENVLVQGGGAEDAERLAAAQDGQIIPVQRPDAMRQVVSSGQTIQQVLLSATTFKELFSWAAGNLDIMGGLSPQSKTARQDTMLNENSSQSVADMQQSTITFVAQGLKSLAWYWWHDPFMVQKSIHSLPGMPELQTQRQVTPQQRKQGRFEDLDIKVDPYSMKHTTPEAMISSLDQMMQQIVIPLLPMLQQQGVMPDMNKYLALAARYRNMPDLLDILTIQEPPQPQEGSSPGAEAGMPGQTERSYIRENMPGRTEQGNNLNLMSALQGVDPGGAQKNGALPPLGGKGP